MKQCKVLINGVQWTIKRVPHDDFPADAQDSQAFVHNLTKSIYFCEEEYSLKTTIHEVFHAYCKSLYLNSTAIPWQDYEEIIAEMLEEKIGDIQKTAKAIYARLK